MRSARCRPPHANLSPCMVVPRNPCFAKSSRAALRIAVRALPGELNRRERRALPGSSTTCLLSDAGMTTFELMRRFTKRASPSLLLTLPFIMKLRRAATQLRTNRPAAFLAGSVGRMRTLWHKSLGFVNRLRTGFVSLEHVLVRGPVYAMQTLALLQMRSPTYWLEPPKRGLTRLQNACWSRHTNEPRSHAGFSRLNIWLPSSYA